MCQRHGTDKTTFKWTVAGESHVRFLHQDEFATIFSWLYPHRLGGQTVESNYRRRLSQSTICLQQRDPHPRAKDK